VSAPRFLALFAIALAAHGAEFSADFSKPLDLSWKWIREDPSAWRLTNGALEIRLLPGNMWGPANDAKSILTRPVPDPQSAPLEITTTVENRPTEQYEQVDLVWYYSDSHMVKIGHELVDGQLSIVMGREEADRTRTISITAIEAHTVDLRFLVRTNRISGFFRPHKAASWQKAGECSLPVLTGAQPRISLQCYQGPAKTERWARITQFRINKQDL
jgi:regulation of enolase protein 1 (concanavalin A-like superfamily)